MALTKARVAIWLAMTVHANTFAQVPVKPGNWELTGSFKGLPFGGWGARPDGVHIRGGAWRGAREGADGSCTAADRRHLEACPKVPVLPGSPRGSPVVMVADLRRSDDDREWQCDNNDA